jgi:hypothetical protein
MMANAASSIDRVRPAARPWERKSLALAFAMAWLHHFDLSLSPAKVPQLRAHDVRACFKRGQRRPSRTGAVDASVHACSRLARALAIDARKLLFFIETCVALRGVAGLSLAVSVEIVKAGRIGRHLRGTGSMARGQAVCSGVYWCHGVPVSSHPVLLSPLPGKGSGLGIWDHVLFETVLAQRWMLNSACTCLQLGSADTGYEPKPTDPISRSFHYESIKLKLRYIPENSNKLLAWKLKKHGGKQSK